MTTDPNAVGQVAVIPGADNWISWAICKITGSHSRHMIIRTSPTECVSADAELDRRRVTRRPLTDFPTAIWSKFDLTPAQQEAIAAFALAQVNKPYAYLDDALIAIERIGRFRFPDWVRRGFQSDGQWQCAQVADAALAAAGVHVFDDGRMIGDVFPGSYEEEMIKRHWYTLAFFESFPLNWRSKHV
jgi:hypothetical protein